MKIIIQLKGDSFHSKARFVCGKLDAKLFSYESHSTLFGKNWIDEKKS